MYEDDFGVSNSPVSLLVYEKSRFEETLIFGQISHRFFAFVYWLSDFNAANKPLLTQCDTDRLTLDDVDITSEEDDNVNQLYMGLSTKPHPRKKILRRQKNTKERKGGKWEIEK